MNLAVKPSGLGDLSGCIQGRDFLIYFLETGLERESLVAWLMDEGIRSRAGEGGSKPGGLFSM